MSYLDNSSKNLDVVVTNLGKRILTDRPHDFLVDRFALTDVDIDYTATSALTATLVNQPSASTDELNVALRTLPKDSGYIFDLLLSNEVLILSTSGIDGVNVTTEELGDEVHGYTVYHNTDKLTLRSKNQPVKAVEALEISRQVGSKLLNSDIYRYKQWQYITKKVTANVITCKNAFTIEAKGVIGEYELIVVGNDSKAQQNIKVIVKS